MTGGAGRIGRYSAVIVALIGFIVAFAVNAHRLQGVGQAVLSAISDAQWSAYQAELELNRTLSAVDRYAAGFDEITREDVRHRVDLLWSRLPLLVEGEQSQPLRQHTDVVAVIKQVEKGLEQVDTALGQGLVGQQLRDVVHEALWPSVEPLQKVVLDIAHATTERQAELQRRVNVLSENHLIALAGVVGMTTILMLMLAAEARRAHALMVSANRAHARIEHVAHHDTLTGLPNRRLFQDRLRMAMAGARRRGDNVALHLIDVDRFKEVNDGFGHVSGDGLLTELAQRLQRCIRDSDTLARIGGDELAVLQTDVGRVEDALILAERMLEEVRHPVYLDGATLQPTISIGVALAPRDGKDGDSLLRNADRALYRAKAEGRDRAAVYTAPLADPASGRSFQPTPATARPGPTQRPIWMRQSGPDEMPKVLAKSP
jgi:diguanylate cyclase (GGDEF)-like protein